MIENSHIVTDTRKIRCFISDRFDNDVDSYIDYLLSRKNRTAVVAESEKNHKHQLFSGGDNEKSNMDNV